jgi:hypothetical protein
MMDLMYFGYEWEADSKTLEAEFIKEVLEKFPDVKLIDARDYIKGYRQEVYLSDELYDEYLMWIVGTGWINSSFEMQIMLMDDTSEIERIFALAKEKYPKGFKTN